ncbi:MAG: hypothetical protein KDB73_18770 [Planctomycetes bacterium]|nr:hypothetical protein [Planctomycetota bacterium]
MREQLSAERFTRWDAAEEAQRLAVEPLLASWNRGDDPEQVRVQRYLAEVRDALVCGLPHDQPVYLCVDVVLPISVDLLHHRDVENYLTPLGALLRAHDFVLAIGTKRHPRNDSDASSISVGLARPASSVPASRFVSARMQGSTSHKSWKERLRASVATQVPTPTPPGPLAMETAWRCGASRQWVNLWKATGDALGPILGEPDAARPFNPADDRITDLRLHLTRDEAMGYDVDVRVWW